MPAPRVPRELASMSYMHSAPWRSVKTFTTHLARSNKIARSPVRCKLFATLASHGLPRGGNGKEQGGDQTDG